MNQERGTAQSNNSTSNQEEKSMFFVLPGTNVNELLQARSPQEFMPNIINIIVRDVTETCNNAYNHVEQMLCELPAISQEAIGDLKRSNEKMHTEWVKVHNTVDQMSESLQGIDLTSIDNSMARFSRLVNLAQNTSGDV